MNNLSIILGFLFGFLFIIFGIYIITEYKVKFVKTDAIVEKATCVLNNSDFNYLCHLQLSYIVDDYKYYKTINKYIKMVPYRKYDVVTIYYNHDNPIDIEVKDSKYLYGIIPLIIGIILLILTFMTLYSII